MSDKKDQNVYLFIFNCSGAIGLISQPHSASMRARDSPQIMTGLINWIYSTRYVLTLLHQPKYGLRRSKVTLPLYLLKNKTLYNLKKIQKVHKVYIMIRLFRLRPNLKKSLNVIKIKHHTNVKKIYIHAL